MQHTPLPDEKYRLIEVLRTRSNSSHIIVARQYRATLTNRKVPEDHALYAFSSFDTPRDMLRWARERAPKTQEFSLFEVIRDQHPARDMTDAEIVLTADRATIDRLDSQTRELFTRAHRLAWTRLTGEPAGECRVLKASRTLDDGSFKISYHFVHDRAVRSHKSDGKILVNERSAVLFNLMLRDAEVRLSERAIAGCDACVKTVAAEISSWIAIASCVFTRATSQVATHV